MDENDYGGTYSEIPLKIEASFLWPYFRALVKILCSIISRCRSYTEWPVQKLKVCFINITACVEIPLLLPVAFVGFIAACITGYLALVILSIKTTWVFRRIGPSVVEALAVRLWWEAQQTFVGLIRGVVAYVSAVIAPALSFSRYYKQSASPAPEPSEGRGEEDDYSQLNAASNDQGDAILKTDFESLGGWKISESLQEPDASTGHSEESYIVMPQERRHRRTGTGSSLRLSGTTSPELIRTPLQMSNESRERRRQRGSGSGASSPESYFRMTVRNETNGTGSVIDHGKYSRSGSSSTSSLRSVGRTSARFSA